MCGCRWGQGRVLKTLVGIKQNETDRLCSLTRYMFAFVRTSLKLSS